MLNPFGTDSDDKITSYWKNRNKDENGSGVSPAVKGMKELVDAADALIKKLGTATNMTSKEYDDYKKILDAKRSAYTDELHQSESLKASILSSLTSMSDGVGFASNDFVKNLKKQFSDADAKSSAAKANLNSVNTAESNLSKILNDPVKGLKDAAESLKGDKDKGEDKKDSDISKLTSLLGNDDWLDGLGSGLAGGLGGALAETLFGGSGGLGSLIDSVVPGISTVIGILSTISGIVGKVHQKLDGSVDEAMNIISNNIGSINARLYGDAEGTSLGTLLSDIANTVKASPFVSQQKMIDNVTRLVESGIDYNIEQRALLMTLNDKLVPTFNALDGTLTRLIRVQQADVSLAQMGAESSLTRLLNAVFKDTSYLNNTYDSVYSAISDSITAQTNTDQATQYAFAIQKWLGALYSVGLSDNAVNSIASALNALGTGDIAKLGDQGQTLLALSANRAGISFASTLTEGLNAEDTNKLLKSMVEYLRDISTNTSSNVVKSQWGDILNLELSDWRAIQNISDEDITTLFNANVTQQSAQDEIAALVENHLDSRYTIAEKIDLIYENALSTFGLNIANDQSKYLKWKIAGLVEQISENLLGGGIASSIVNIFAGAFDLFTFAGDYAGIAQNMLSAVLQEDQAIGNILSKYQFTMNRGTGYVFDPNAATATSTISSSLALENVGEASFGFEENEVASPFGQATTHVGAEGRVFGGGTGRSFEIPEEQVTEATTQAPTLTLAEQEALGISATDKTEQEVAHEQKTAGLSLYEQEMLGVSAVDATESEVTAQDYYNDVGMMVTTSAADQGFTTMQQQENWLTANSQNIMSSEEGLLVRDINDLYAELFERQTTPIRVSIAKVEEQGQLDLHIMRIDSIDDMVHGTISVSAEGSVWDSVQGMRG